MQIFTVMLLLLVTSSGIEGRRFIRVHNIEDFQTPGGGVTLSGDGVASEILSIAAKPAQLAAAAASVNVQRASPPQADTEGAATEAPETAKEILAAVVAVSKNLNEAPIVVAEAATNVVASALSKVTDKISEAPNQQPTETKMESLAENVEEPQVAEGAAIANSSDPSVDKLAQIQPAESLPQFEIPSSSPSGSEYAEVAVV